MLTLDDLKEVESTDLEFALEFVNARHYAQMTAPKEHYKLLAFLAKKTKGKNKTFYDIGTYKGLSAIALAANSQHKVVSYDIVNYLECKTPDNVEFKIGDFYEDKKILKSPIILTDVEPHTGEFETKLLNWLIENNYKGLLIIDDIHLTPEIENFWNQIELEKIDATEYGHYSGTGIVIFNP